MRLTGILILIIFRCHFLMASVLNLEPWDEVIEDDVCCNVSIENEVITSKPFLDNIVLSLIKYYQTDISETTISRCPFKISCSHFAQEAITNKGLFIGTALFIDRNWFREHNHSYFHYPLSTNQNGVLKLDDTFYLED